MTTTCGLLPAFALAVPAFAETKAEVLGLLWAKEVAIYTDRANDSEPYRGAIARDYAGWPPQAVVPVHAEQLRAKRTGARPNQGKIDLELVDFALNDDTAVIYYRTHRTRRADGTPVDERFETTHTWIKQDGDWKVMGGMARATPPR